MDDSSGFRNPMNAMQLMKFAGELGAYYPESKLAQIYDYFYRMLHDGRVIIIEDDNLPFAICFFSITGDSEPFWMKPTWTYLEHDSRSSHVYIEKLICRKWTRQMRHLIEQAFLDKHPHLLTATWHRETKQDDRTVKTRRLNHVHN